jgi:hypothetical protein
MNKKIILSFLILATPLLLGACENFMQPQTYYWHQARIHPDMVPDSVHAQAILERDIVMCSCETQDLNTLSRNNDPVSVPPSHVVRGDGVSRKEAGLPTVYAIEDCMKAKGWTKLDHYYIAPGFDK